MDIGTLTERLMGMDDSTWARHANPWSGWTRMPILPLIVVTLWYRDPLGGWIWVILALLVLWTWVNPRVFSEPRSMHSWMSRAVLGERLWLARKENAIPQHHARMALVLNSMASLGMLILIWGIWRMDAGLTLAGLSITMGGKMWFLDRMVWLHADMHTA